MKKRFFQLRSLGPGKPVVAQAKQESPPMPGADASESPAATATEKAAAEKKVNLNPLRKRA
jgi:hypothetical protein